jgi:hypothetical protein
VKATVISLTPVYLVFGRKENMKLKGIINITQNEGFSEK